MAEKNRDTSGDNAQSGRAAAENRDDSFNMLAWLAEGAAGIASELKNSDLGLGEDFWKHTYNARREGLLAARAILDRIIEQGEQENVEEAEREKRRERRGKISIG